MVKTTKILFVVILALFLVMAVNAQETGEGGILIGTNFGGDPITFNPLLSTTTVEGVVNNYIWPNIYNIDPATRAPMKGGRNDEENGLALDWAISDDGLTYTFTLRDDLTWSDGVPVTANDYKFTYDALASEQTSSPRTDVLSTIESVTVIDDYTLEITLQFNSCKGLDELNDFGILPAHAVQEIIGDDYSLIDTMDFNKEPTVTSGVFNFGALVPGEQTSLVANPEHNMTVSPAGYIIRNVPDQVVEVEQFLAGEVTSLGTSGGVPAQRMQEFRDRAAEGEFQIYEFVDDGMTFMGFNLADPTNPQSAEDEDGNPIDQGIHPIFGDVRVRQAIAQAINYDDIINGAANGEAVQVNTYGTPALWGYNPNIPAYEYNPDAALALLAEAGWVDHDDDPSTPLQANEDAMYAEPGTEFTFELATNAGNATREAIGTIVQDQLGQIGIDVDFQIQEFGALVERLLGQEVDVILIGFTNLDPDTDARNVFTPAGDLVGGGFNFVSYNNPRVTELYDEALRVPGCDLEERQAIYWEIGEILHEELPWLTLFAGNVMYADSNAVEGWDPFAEYRYTNMASLSINP